MKVLLVSDCHKRALKNTRRILDQYAIRVGHRTWYAHISAQGLQAVRHALAAEATRATAVRCFAIERGRFRLRWHVGRLAQTNEHGHAPLSVRNRVQFFDSHIEAGATVEFPSIAGWDTYFYVFEGAIGAGETRFNEAESGLLVDGDGVSVTALAETLLVAFCIDPDAPVTRQGTIGR